MKTLTTEEYTEKAKRIHKNKYIYSNVKYKNIDTYIEIICKVHGSFWQRPDHHLGGSGCKKCRGELISIRFKSNLKDFIKESRKIHNNFYSYKKSIYTTARNKLIITCPIHGDFEQIAHQHKIGTGCPICGNLKAIEHNKKDILKTHDFIKRAKEIHGEEFDYSLTVTSGYKNKIVIICKKHGKFNQHIGNHLLGRKCPKCKKYSKAELYISNILKNKNIEFVFQKKYNDCINDKTGFKFPFDFYIPKINTIIEYDGAQHFIPNPRFGGKYALKETQRRDKIKNKYSLKNNISILRISYKENIIDKLIQYKVINSL